MTTSPGAVIAGHPFRLSSHIRSSAGSSGPEQLLRDGLVRNVLADVFVAADVADSQRLRALAAGLLIPAHRQQDRSWVLGYSSAAWVYTGLVVPPRPTGDLHPTEPPEPTEPPAPPAPPPVPRPTRAEVIVMAGNSRPADPWIRNRQSRLDAADVVLVHGLPVSDPIRTAADIARDLPAAQAIPMLARLAELEGFTARQVLLRLAGMRYARGAARARTTIQQWQEWQEWPALR